MEFGKGQFASQWPAIPIHVIRLNLFIGVTRVQDLCAKTKVVRTGWRNVNLLYFPDSIEIASFLGFTL